MNIELIATGIVVVTFVIVISQHWHKRPAHPAKVSDVEQSRPPVDATMKLLEMHLPYGWKCFTGGHVDDPCGNPYVLDVVTMGLVPVFRIRQHGEFIDAYAVFVDPSRLAAAFVIHYNNRKEQP